MLYTFKPRGVCPGEMKIELSEDRIVQELEVSGGCSGNLQGIARLIEGMPARNVIEKLKGIRCGFRSTSCPDQLAVALEQFLEEQDADKKI